MSANQPPSRANFARAGSWPRAAGGARPSRASQRPEAASRPRRRPEAAQAPGFGCSGPQRGPVYPARSLLPRISLHPSARGSANGSIGREKHGFFSARLRTPFRENAPVKFYFPLQTTFPCCQELRPGEIKYPILLLGSEGRGREGDTRTKYSLQPACPHQITPGEAREGPLGR